MPLGKKGPDRPAWLSEDGMGPLMEPMEVSWAAGSRDFHVLIDDWAGKRGAVIRVHWRGADEESARQGFEDWILGAMVRRFHTDLNGHHWGESGWSFRTGSLLSWVVLTLRYQSHDV